jgi:hypothetical protein
MKSSSQETIQARFEEFDRMHPEVWEMFLRFARDAHQRGRKRFGAKMIMERIRWYFTIESHPDSKEPFKLNNNYTARYVRKLHAMHPELGHLFATRRIQTP